MAEQINQKRWKYNGKPIRDHGICAYGKHHRDLKALADVCVTVLRVSIVRKLPYQDILFLPDKNLGSFGG